MDVSISAKQMDLTDSLKNYVEERINRVNKYTDFNLSADVFLSVEKHRKHIHATIKGNGFYLNSEAEDPANMYKAIDLCVDKLEKQLRRGKYNHHDKKKGKELEREGIISNHRNVEQEAVQQ
jgi:ribosome hibernation promoting factor